MIRFLKRAFVFAMLFAATAAQSQQATPDQAKAVWEAAKQAMTRGPAAVPLVDQATLQLPQGFAFVPNKEALAIMQLMGNRTSPSFIGLIFPIGSKSHWFASLNYKGEGHIKDDEAKDWKADDLLDNLKKGTEAGNEFRTKQGVPPIEVTGWIEPPAYDADNHRLVWSVGIRDKGASSGDDDGVNYNTYVLGREGYIALDFITSLKDVEAEKPIAGQLLAAVNFNSGRQYADFKPSTDKLAGYGIAALVGGVVLKKIGLFAVAAAFFAKFFKLIAIAFVAFGASIRKLFRRKP